MTWRNFIGQNQLQAAVEAARDAGLPAHARIFEDQYPSDRFCRRDEASGLQNERPDVLVFPQSGNAPRVGERWNERMEDFPKRREVLRVETGIELRARAFPLARGRLGSGC